MQQMHVTITDDRWPKLTIVIKRDTDRGPVVSQESFQYDGAYNVFEAALHNHLRPMVEEIIKRRKR